MNLKKHFPKACITDRIESTTSVGFPDVVAQIGDDIRLIELKVAHKNSVVFRRSQQAWHFSRAGKNASAFILVDNQGPDSKARFLVYRSHNMLELLEKGTRAQEEFSSDDLSEICAHVMA